MSNPNLTLINVILDRSGSMTRLREATVKGLNEFLVTQRAAPGEAQFSLVQFDHEYLPTIQYKNLKDVADLTMSDYVPRGNTALLDAIGKNLNDVGAYLASLPENDRPGKVIVVIQTDGEENASKEFDFATIKSMISHQTEKYAWDFIFLGANQDAIQTGSSLGVQASRSLSYTSSVIGTSNTFRGLGSKMSMARGNSGDAGLYAASLDMTTQDREAAMQEDSMGISGVGGYARPDWNGTGTKSALATGLKTLLSNGSLKGIDLDDDNK